MHILFEIVCCILFYFYGLVVANGRQCEFAKTKIKRAKIKCHQKVFFVRFKGSRDIIICLFNLFIASEQRIKMMATFARILSPNCVIFKIIISCWSTVARDKLMPLRRNATWHCDTQFLSLSLKIKTTQFYKMHRKRLSWVKNNEV